MNRDKVGIYILSGTKGNLKNIVTGEIILNNEVSKEIDEALLLFMQNNLERKSTEYCLIKGKGL